MSDPPQEIFDDGEWKFQIIGEEVDHNGEVVCVSCPFAHWVVLIFRQSVVNHQLWGAKPNSCSQLIAHLTDILLPGWMGGLVSQGWVKHDMGNSTNDLGCPMETISTESTKWDSQQVPFSGSYDDDRHTQHRNISAKPSIQRETEEILETEGTQLFRTNGQAYGEAWS